MRMQMQIYFLHGQILPLGLRNSSWEGMQNMVMNIDSWAPRHSQNSDPKDCHRKNKPHLTDVIVMKISKH